MWLVGTAGAWALQGWGLACDPLLSPSQRHPVSLPIARAGMHADCLRCSPVCRWLSALVQHAISAEALDILSRATDAKGRQLQVGGLGRGAPTGKQRAGAVDSADREREDFSVHHGMAKGQLLSIGCQCRH